MASGNHECVLPESAIVMAKARGIDHRRKPQEKMIDYACRVMNVDRNSLRFTLSAGVVRVHYNYPDLLNRTAYELALELKNRGVPESAIGLRILPLDSHALYNIVLFSKHVNVAYLKQILKTQHGAKAATTWSYMPCSITICLLNGSYDTVVAESHKGVAASLCNPDGFSAADFAFSRAYSRRTLNEALRVITNEQLIPKASRTYRILVSKFTIGHTQYVFDMNNAVLAAIRVLRSKHCYCHASDVETTFNALHSFSTTSNATQTRQLCGHVIPALVTFFTNIKFTPTRMTPWWFFQLLHTSINNQGIRFAGFMQSMHTVNNANAKLLLMPFRPEYQSRWPISERESALTTYQELLQVPYFTLWQATTLNTLQHLTPWTPNTHRQWPTTFRRAIKAFVLSTQTSDNGVYFLPLELIELVLRFCFKHDFRL